MSIGETKNSRKARLRDPHRSASRRTRYRGNPDSSRGREVLRAWESAKVTFWDENLITTGSDFSGRNREVTFQDESPRVICR